MIIEDGCDGGEREREGERDRERERGRARQRERERGRVTRVKRNVSLEFFTVLLIFYQSFS